MGDHDLNRMAKRVASRVLEGSSEVPDESGGHPRSYERGVNEEGFSTIRDDEDAEDEEPFTDEDGSNEDSIHDVEYADDLLKKPPSNEHTKDETDWSNLNPSFNKPQVPDNVRS